jgi:predicted AlkP superfamily phosphohydrolase/phosphomutase
MVQFFGKQIPLSECIEEVYRQMDARVGEVMQRLEPSDTLMLCADHGFTSFRRQMDVNGWLIEEGFLALKDGASKRDGSSPFGYVDWSRTKAYSLGLGMVYLNLEGREPLGIVSQEDARSVLEDIAARAVAATDGANSVVRDAEIVWDKYPGEWKSKDYPCSDLMLGFDEFYRAGWNTVTGGVRLIERDGELGPGPVYRDNTNPWSGDHAGNSPSLVTGIFFSNKKVSVPDGGVSVLHIAPTVLDALGVPIPDALDLGPLQR